MSIRTANIRHAATAFCILALSPLLMPAAGQSVEDGVNAYNAGDYEAALENLRPLAEQGDATAQMVLGHMYQSGRGVMPDYAEAARWNHLAAEQGDVRAQLLLGLLYSNGDDLTLPLDHVTAHMWANIAAANGAPADLRDTIAERLSPAQIVEAQRRARVCMGSNYQDCD